MTANTIGELRGNHLKISCLSVDCPERNGGKCRFDPRSPRDKPLTKEQTDFLKVWRSCQEIIGFYPDNPAKALKELNRYADRVLTT